jgi:TRAP-type C4-dicarboxylate transport system substrate-binding protein
MARWGILIVIACLGLTPHAPTPAPEPTTLRMAAIAPAGTTWAALLTTFGDEVERATRGQLRVKWMLGGIAGDELATLERVRTGELEGLAGAIFCQRVAPSLRALEVAGLARNDDESSEVLGKLRPLFDEEAAATPFAFLAISSGFGHRVLFSRTAVHRLADLKEQRYWVYDLDEVEKEQLALMGANVVPLPLDQAADAYDHGRVDGFFSIPWAAVAYRYGVKARYFTDLDSMFLPACMIVSRPVFDRLGGEAQRALINAGAEVEARFARLGRQQHDELLDRVFPREGLQAAPMSAEFRREYLAAARAASARLGPRLVPLPLVRRVNGILEAARARAKETARAPPSPPPME